ncbi:hypothetical protein T08_10839 [Trichinella sp. T8]|nr:hypothetical protein T08_10839 [Trichinella sp. T8]
MYHLKKYGSEKDENELCKCYSKSNNADVSCEMFSLLRFAKVCAVLETTDMTYLSPTTMFTQFISSYNVQAEKSSYLKINANRD